MKTGVKVSDAMTYNPISVSVTTTLKDCAIIMDKKEIGSLLVKDGDVFKGIITEWDIVRKAVAKGKDPAKLKAKDIMVSKLVTISPNQDIYDALMKMRNNDIRHLPVVQKDKLVGFLTLKDVLKIQPELFDIMVDKIDIREASEKPVGGKKTPGKCGMCGNESRSLMDVNGIFLCRECRQRDYESFK